MSTITGSRPPKQAEASESPRQIVQQQPDRLSDILHRIIALEFLAIFLAANFGMALYYFIVFNSQVSLISYVQGAPVIAVLIVLISGIFHHYSKIQSQRKRWYAIAGLGAVGLAFSLFYHCCFC